MKWIKKYKLFESINQIDQIISDCKDIFQELIDQDRKIRVRVFYKNYKNPSAPIYLGTNYINCPTHNIKPNSEIFKIELFCPKNCVFPISKRKELQITEYPDRLYDYMLMQGFEMIDKNTILNFIEGPNEYVVWWLYQRKKN
jgi:hypothetical protein